MGGQADTLKVVKESRIVSVGGKLVTDSDQLSAAVKDSSRPMQVWFTKAKTAEELAAAKAKIKELEATASTAATPPCLLYTSPSPRDQRGSRMPSSA